MSATASPTEALVSRALLIVGALGGVLGLFLPWMSVEPRLPVPLVAELLSGTGVLPSGEAIRGVDIPKFVRDTGDNVIVQGSLTARHLWRGELQRASARVLFGERDEERLAPLVFAPAALGAASLLLLFLRPPSRVALCGCVLLLLTVAAGLWAMARVEQASSSVRTEVLAGMPATCLALALAAGGAFLRSPKVRARRAIRRAKPQLRSRRGR